MCNRIIKMRERFIEEMEKTRNLIVFMNKFLKIIVIFNIIINLFIIIDIIFIVLVINIYERNNNCRLTIFYILITIYLIFSSFCLSHSIGI